LLSNVTGRPWIRVWPRRSVAVLAHAFRKSEAGGGVKNFI
jgi:hypothetical protein